MSVAACAQKLPVIPPTMKKPTKVIANRSSIVKNVTLLTNEEIHPQTFMEAGNAIITVITKNNIRALLSIPTKYIW